MWPQAEDAKRHPTILWSIEADSLNGLLRAWGVGGRGLRVPYTGIVLHKVFWQLLATSFSRDKAPLLVDCVAKRPRGRNGHGGSCVPCLFKVSLSLNQRQSFGESGD